MRPFRNIPTNKYGAKRTGHYSSKREAEYAHELGLRKAATNGDVLAWVVQVPVRLQGGVVYRVDFLVFLKGGGWELVEIKGCETASWRSKMRQMSEAHPELFANLKVLK